MSTYCVLALGESSEQNRRKPLLSRIMYHSIITDAESNAQAGPGPIASVSAPFHNLQ